MRPHNTGNPNTAFCACRVATSSTRTASRGNSAATPCITPSTACGPRRTRRTSTVCSMRWSSSARTRLWGSGCTRLRGNRRTVGPARPSSTRTTFPTRGALRQDRGPRPALRARASRRRAAHAQELRPAVYFRESCAVIAGDRCSSRARATRWITMAGIARNTTSQTCAACCARRDRSVRRSPTAALPRLVRARIATRPAEDVRRCAVAPSHGR